MSWRQDFAEIGDVVEVATRVATARQRCDVGKRRNEGLARIGKTEQTTLWLAPPGWERTLETYRAGLGQDQAAADRQAGMKAGGEEEAAVRASAGAAMLLVSHSFGESSISEGKVGYSLENAVANLLHVADEVGVDPFQVLAGALDRYSDTLEVEADGED